MPEINPGTGTSNYNSQVTYPGGWTCAWCGAFVLTGNSHTCHTYSYPQPASRTVWFTSISPDDIDRIARCVVEMLNERKADADG